MRAYLIDTPRTKSAAPINKIISIPLKIITRDSGMSRRTHVDTYIGAEYSSLREVDDLKIFDESNESQPPKLVCVYPGSAFVAENGNSELKIFLVSSEPVGTKTLGDTHFTGMTPKRFHAEVVLRERRKQCGGLR
jgi:hypothetical protein